MTPKNELIFLPLGGSGEIGMNVNLYGCQGKWIMVDLGMTFSDPAYPGVELVLPDLQFIEERRDDLLGIVLTHGHEDHIGAIPYLIEDLGVPLYATPFTAGLIRKKLQEEGIEDDIELNIIENEGEVELGPFRCRYVPLAHSIPEGNALLIDTPFGSVFHTGDWKIDREPVMGSPTTAEELTRIGDEGVLALVGDSTNVFNPRESGSESGVREALDKVVAEQEGRVLVTTFASNAARLHTLGQVAQDCGRRICVVGRSLHRILEVANSVGYLTDFPPVLREEDAMKLPRNEVMILATGAQGEARAALSRIAQGEHPRLKLERGDTVIYSSKEIPGNELAIGVVQNALAAAGVRIITERQANVHVSGHPGIPELQAMYSWIRPQIAVPVHGERRHMEAHAALAKSVGVPDQVVPMNGTAIRLAPGTPEIISHEAVGRLVLDGEVIVPADGETMVGRRRLLHNGWVGIFLALGKNGLAAEPVLQIEGVPVEDERADFVAECTDAAKQAVRKASGKSDDAIAEAVRVAVRRTARDWTGKKPLTRVSTARVS
ncbi:ribonuclease J [Pacificimonas flava]|uniref:Metallo-beta-lactamase family protein, RNA-specific n=1 Tax=Pacificimonas flava TaxID=1234595 RepID=M2U8H5_9SPHN|nr:ribonuclease J [Pacificimonas flava]EMD84283.1 Metallo-beta-lactamase family protein, RNA-specific [Pacificimonas flava]MBB5279841.1 ribonuclease J [Pacificimonas flava]